MSKLKAIHIGIIGVVVCVIIGVATYFLVIKKYQEEFTALRGRLDAATQVANTRGQVERRLQDARINNQKLQVELEKYMRAKMPAISFQDRTQGMIALWKEHAETLGPMVKAWPERSGVSMSGNLQIPSPPVDPNAVDTSLIKIPLGSFTANGDFATLMQHVRSWNKFNRLVQIDVGSLSGVSPYMSLNYNATVYIFPRGDTGPNVTMASGGTPPQ